MKSMNNKPNGNSILHGLPPEQRERVDFWLFDENVSYTELVDRCRQLLNVKVSKSSARRYYERECFKRRQEAPACPPGERKKMATALRKQSEDDYFIALGLTSQVAATEALKPEDHADTEKLNDAMRMMIAMRKEDNNRQLVALHRRRVALAEKRFQFNAAIECFEHQREMKEIMDKKMEDGAKVMEIRERLFGPNLPE